MSSDPKKPGLDAPPQGTPDLLQKDLALDRRRRVPTFEELQAARQPPAPDVPTDPMRPAMHRPIPNATVPARPGNLDEAATQQRPIPPGLNLRQPVVPIRTPTPPTQPVRVAMAPPPPAPQMRAPAPLPPRPAAQPPQAQPQQRAPMPPPSQNVPAQPQRAPMPPPGQQQQQRAPMPPPPQGAAPQAARAPMPPPPQGAAPQAPMPPPQGAAPQAPRAPMPPAQPPRTMTPGPAPMARPPPGNTPRPAAQPQRTPEPSTQPLRQPVTRGTHESTGLLDHRTEPPSPTEYAQQRPAQAAMAMPQVTPSVPSQGALRPDGQPAPLRPSQQGMKPAPAPPPRALGDEPEPLTMPAAAAPPRTFTPPPAPPRKPNVLPAELLVTQPGLPGPFAARELPHHQAVPQRPPSLTELPRAQVPDSGLQPTHGGEPQFEEPSFEAGQGAQSDTVTAEPAAVWRRVGAWVTDLIFVSTLVLIFLMVAITVIAPKNLTPLQQLVAIAVPGAALAGVLAFVYTTLFAFLWAGRTPGRRLMGIRLVTVTGHSPGPARALLRAALSLVSFALCLSGFWLALFDRHGQTLHDKLTRTFVVKLQDA